MSKYLLLWSSLSLSLGLAGCAASFDIKTKDGAQLQKAVQQFTQDQSAFSYAKVDLNQDGTKDAVVLLQGPNWCGSGGCTLLVFKGLAHKNYQLISKSTVVNTPIYALSSSHQQWRDLSVYSKGTGQVLMQFDGLAYPSNPSLLSEYKIDHFKTTDSKLDSAALRLELKAAR